MSSAVESAHRGVATGFYAYAEDCSVAQATEDCLLEIPTEVLADPVYHATALETQQALRQLVELLERYPRFSEELGRREQALLFTRLEDGTLCIKALGAPADLP